jgi:DNA-directed RNA polymerase specialized sigma24 family protein
MVSRLRKRGCPEDQAEDVVQNLIYDAILAYNSAANANAAAYLWTQLNWYIKRYYATKTRDCQRFVDTVNELENTDWLDEHAAKDRLIADMITDQSVAKLIYSAVSPDEFPILDAIGYGWTTIELADALGVSLEATRARKSRLIKTLRQRFATEDILS